jgi:hypothetical protein
VAWITPQEVKQAVADALHQSGGVAALEPWWQGEREGD